MNWFQKISFLERKASVTFSIVGSHKIAQPKTIQDICYVMIRWAYDNIPKEIFEANPFTVVADGFSFDQYLGTMNWYTDNPQAVVPYIQRAIQTELEPIGIQAYVREINQSQSNYKQAIRVEVTANETQDLEQLPEMNIANGNYYELNRLLQLTGDQEFSGSMSAQDLLARISMARGQVDMYTRPPEETGGPGTGQAEWIDFGLDTNRLTRYLDTLEQMAEYALKMNNATIHWG